MTLTTGQTVTARGFTGTLEGFARDGEVAVIVGADGISSRRVPVADLVTEPDPYSCAECGKSGLGTYVVTMLDEDTRTEVCRDCDEALRFEYVVIARMGKRDPESIVGRYRSRFDAEAVAAAWNRSNAGVATYSVADAADY